MKKHVSQVRWVRRIKPWNGPPTDGRPWVADVRTFDIPETIAACISNAAPGMVAIPESSWRGWMLDSGIREADNTPLPASRIVHQPRAGFRVELV